MTVLVELDPATLTQAIAEASADSTTCQNNICTTSSSYSSTVQASTYSSQPLQYVIVPEYIPVQTSSVSSSYILIALIILSILIIGILLVVIIK
ncbi:MAG: hypothetical protein QXI16_03205 [Sulfolobaceae archaeon]